MTGKYNIYLNIGTTFNIQLELTDDSGSPIDLTDSSVRSQMRKSYFSSTFYEFSISILDETGGIISMQMDSDTTDGIEPGKYVYDIELEEQSGVVSRILEGVVIARPQVTR